MNDLVRGEADESAVVPKLREYGIDILDACRWVAAVIHVERADAQTLALPRELIPISVRGRGGGFPAGLLPLCRF